MPKDKKASSSLLAQWRKQKQQGQKVSAIPKLKNGAQAIASPGQQRLWLLQSLYPDNPFYQYAHQYTISGNLDVEKLKQSWEKLWQRHEILRCNFKKQEEDLFLNISQTELNFKYIDLSNTSITALEKQQADFINLPFDLSRDALLRISVFKIESNQHLMLLSIHHIIGDRWSLNVLNKELFECYEALMLEKEWSPAPLTINYKDFAHWKAQQVTPKSEIDYWLKNLAGDLPILQLPIDHEQPARPSFKGQLQKHLLPLSLSEKLVELARQEGVTMFALMLSTFKILLHRLSRQEEIIVGSPFSNRDKVALEKLVGFFNETLVLKSSIDGELTFLQFLKQTTQTIFDAQANKQVPFDELVKLLKVERHGTSNPLFQTMFLYSQTSSEHNKVSGLVIKDEMLDLEVAKFDLTLFVNQDQNQLELAAEYASDLFEQNTIKRWLHHFEVLLHSIVDHPQSKLQQLDVLTPAEKELQLEQWNDTYWEMPKHQSICQVIEQHIENTPNQIAVSFKEQRLTYQELGKKANAIAAHLVQKGISKNEVVGLYCERGIEMVIGILGILKAGSAYLPLDPDYPSSRIDFMIEDAEVKYIITPANLNNKLNSSKEGIINFESIDYNQAFEKLIYSADDLAYIIYTSGSTGKPKGVPINHSNLLHSTLSRWEFYPSNPSAFLLLSSFSFDSSIVGIFWTLCNGGNLVLPPKRAEQDVFQLSLLIHQHQVSHTLMLPSLYSAILDFATNDKIHSLQNVMVAGEACPFSLIKKHYQRLPNTDLFNEYGPTEAAVWCIAHRIRPDEKRFVPIGKAIPNSSIYILDKSLNPVPIGVPGEIFIGGSGLSKGYLNRPDLTEMRFIDHPFKPDEKLYKTGDLARFHEDGIIEFLGRVDQQIKIRGFRVELGEIEKVILRQPSINEVIVNVTGESVKQLVAYLTGVDIAQVDTLRVALAKELPDYMVPGIIIPLDHFPKLPNGKINRKALPKPDQSFNENNQYQAPQNDLQKQLQQIWQSTLGIDKISIHDNFFTIGGDSILSIQIVAKARAAGIELAGNQVFEHQTIASLAQSIETINQVSDAIELDEPAPKTGPLSYLQEAFYFNYLKSEKDQGLLQLSFTLSGNIEHTIFEKAWQFSFQKHDAVRAFVKETDGKLSQQIADNINPDWHWLDWSKQNHLDQESLLEQLKQEDQLTGIRLESAPASRFKMIKISENKHILFWTCHHIFLDGWSCGTILKDSLLFYSKLKNSIELKKAVIPNYLAFNNWLNQEDQSKNTKFWQAYLKGFQPGEDLANGSSKEQSFQDLFFKLDSKQSDSIRQFCQAQQIALSTFFQGLWALVLRQWDLRDDVVFGTTVSGRALAFPHMEELSGLFMNIIPYRMKWNPQQSFGDHLKAAQKQQGKLQQAEHSQLTQINKSMGWSASNPVFNALFVFGNFLKNGFSTPHLSVDHFEGGFSSNYPLTIRVNPLDLIEIDLRFDAVVIDKDQVEWMKATILLLIQQLDDAVALESVKSFTQSIVTAPPKQKIKQESIVDTLQTIYEPPTNSTEKKLCSIWQALFNVERVGIHHNFFELGGTSLLAIQLFGLIEQELDIVLSPATLIKHPEIKQLARFILHGDRKEQSLMIALRKSGSRSPLFCIHGGGAHVFFYQQLANYLPSDQPVYSIQAPEFETKEQFPNSIKSMASYYIKLIKEIQPQGPYRLLGTCFSNAVVLEMANQLEATGENIERLFVIDSGPVHLFGNANDGKRKTMTRFFDMLRRGDFKRIQKKLQSRFFKNQTTLAKPHQTESSAERNLRLTVDLLNKLYANYDWKPYNGDIYFIRSSEFNARKDKNYHLSQWKKLTKGELKVHVVPGHHITLFEDPEAKGLAAKIDACITN